MRLNETYSLCAHVARFGNDQACHDYLVQVRWNGKPQCPACENYHMNYYLAKRNIYECSKCYKQFSVIQGTIFHKSKVPLNKWFMAIYLFTVSKRGISSIQLGKFLGVKQHTAWFMLHRLREAMKSENEIILNGIVEVDETYVGPKINRDKRLQAAKLEHEKQQISNKKYTRRQRLKLEGHRKRGRKKGETKEVLENRKKNSVITKQPRGDYSSYENYIIALGMMERQGKIVVKLLGKSRRDINSAKVYPLLENHISEHATIVTDQLNLYDNTKHMFKEHLTVNHDIGFVVDGVSTNGIENVWKHFKKTIEATYFHLSYHHFENYLNEYSYRWNRRNESELTMFEDFMPLVSTTKVTYKELKNKNEDKMAA